MLRKAPIFCEEVTKNRFYSFYSMLYNQNVGDVRANFIDINSVNGPDYRI